MPLLGIVRDLPLTLLDQQLGEKGTPEPAPHTLDPGSPFLSGKIEEPPQVPPGPAPLFLKVRCMSLDQGRIWKLPGGLDIAHGSPLDG
jgi:hypothetical protein